MPKGNPTIDPPIIQPFKSPWWALNGHVHTVISSQFAQIYPLHCERLEISTPDEDFLELDIARVKQPKAVVALFHGLEGSSERFYIRNLMYELTNAGYSCVAMNFRGCGSRLNRQKRFYHSGETTDYNTIVNWILENFSGIPVCTVGFSLGGNAMIKYLGELGENSPIKKAVAVSPPYDLKLGSYNLQKGFNRIYEFRFLQTLKTKLELKRQQYPDIPTFTGSTIFDFDDQITAPIHGFKDAIDYYDTCSSKNFFEHVRTPLFIIHSIQDTLTPLKFAPFQTITSNPHIDTLFTENGGHVGFISSPRNWLNKTIVSWLNA